MTHAEYMGCLRDLSAEVDAAQDSGNHDRILGASMALDAFLSVVRPPEVVAQKSKPLRPLADETTESKGERR